MLRITRVKSEAAITLKVEGRIAADSVSLLERECALSLREADTVRVDLSGVTFVDGRGVDMLKRLRTERLRIVDCPVILDDLLWDGCA